MGSRWIGIAFLAATFVGGCSSPGSPPLAGGQSGTDSNDSPPPCAGSIFTAVETDRCIESIGWSADEAWAVFEGSHPLVCGDGSPALTLEIGRGTTASFTNQIGPCGLLRLEVDASVREASGSFRPGPTLSTCGSRESPG